MNNRSRQIIFARERILRLTFCTYGYAHEWLKVGWLSQGAIKQIRDAGGEVLEW